MKYCIDGRFLGQMSSGVDRYAYNIVLSLDKICAGKDIELLVPPQAVNIPEFRNIKVIKGRSGKLWMQGVFGLYARRRRAVPVTLCNEISMTAPRGIVCLHDVCYAESEELFPQVKDYPPEEVKWFNTIYKRIKRKADKVITVSEFSKERIKDRIGIEDKRITVIGNGWQHFNKVEPDDSVLVKYHLEKGRYFFTVSSPNKNKNVNWVLECAKANPDEIFVISGKNLDRIIESTQCKNVIYVGFASDSQIKSLMSGSKAFIFPSYYEGFGIPPLEALSTGCRIIVSDRASLPEIFMDSAVYISPDDPYVDIENLMNQEVSGSEEILAKYSWDGQAAKLNALLV